MASKNEGVVKHACHEFPPLVDADSEILILGSFPSVLSRKMAFYYGHPMNRFWKVLAALTQEEVPTTIAEKTALCRKHHIALYDSLEECDIHGSSDASITNPVPADLTSLIQGTHIRKILLNGKKSEECFLRYQPKFPGISIYCVPSTSPANAAWSLERLIAAWLEAFSA